MSLSKRQLAEIRRKTRAELLEAGVIDLKDILSREDIRLMESIKFDARHIVSKINGVTLLSEIADPGADDPYANTDDAQKKAFDDAKSVNKYSNVTPGLDASMKQDADKEEKDEKQLKAKVGGNDRKKIQSPAVTDKEKIENYFSDLFIKYAGKILLFVLKLLRKVAGGSATLASSFATFGFKKTILRVLKYLGLSDESAKSAEEFFSKLVYHSVDLIGGGKPLDVVISTLEDEKPEDVSKMAVTATKMAKEEMKTSKEKSKAAKKEAETPAAKTPAAKTPAAKTESLTRLNKEIMILERRFRNQKRI